jgi:hypothetical protein
MTTPDLIPHGLDFRIDRSFDFVRSLLGPDAVDDVYHAGKAPLNGGGGSPATPKGTLIGRLWHRTDVGEWWAAPETSVNWADTAWFGPFGFRREAAMFLVAMATPHPAHCPSCDAPVHVGNPPVRALLNRDFTAHSCPGALSHA